MTGRAKHDIVRVKQAAGVIWQVVATRSLEERERMGASGLTSTWIMDILTNLLVPALVWALVIAGLVWVVQDKMREDRRNEVDTGARAWGVRACKRWTNQRNEGR